MEKHIYIVVSRTPSKFAKAIRKTMKVEYNHASIALDEDLEEIYAFARFQNNIPVAGGLVKENASRFTLCQEEDVKIKIFKIPVSEEQYQGVQHIIEEILNDEAYMYNLFSALTYPVLRGFETYKAYTCIEFVMVMLLQIGLELDKPACSYQPQDLVEMLKDYEHYTGGLLEYREFEQDPNSEFFEKTSMCKYMKVSSYVMGLLMFRLAMGIYTNMANLVL